MQRFHATALGTIDFTLHPSSIAFLLFDLRHCRQQIVQPLGQDVILLGYLFSSVGLIAGTGETGIGLATNQSITTASGPVLERFIFDSKFAGFV